MNYKTIKAGKLLDAILRARGFDPDHYTLTANEREQYADIVNQALRTAWEAEHWPQLFEVEQRRYRPNYNAETVYALDQEVWHGDAYWRSLDAGNLGNTPEEGSAWWTDAVEAGMIHFLPFEQEWADDNGVYVGEIDPAGVDLRACVYDKDPLLMPGAAPVPGCGFWQRNILVPEAVAPLEPYVRFRPLAPEYSFTEWAAGTAYAAGELCYMAGTQETYVALRPSTGESPDASTDDWRPVGFPRMFFDYTRLQAKGELAADDEGKYKTFAAAAAELERLAERHMRGTAADGRAVFRWKRGV